MFTNAMSSAEDGQSTAAPCLHGSDCALASFGRANARERDAAKQHSVNTGSKNNLEDIQ